MSEEILKSLTLLLAIVSKQDNVVSDSERNYVISLLGQELDPESLNKYLEQFDRLTNYEVQKHGMEKEDPSRALSVKETVQTLAICNKISKSLEQKQKIFLLIKILQLIAVDSHFTPQKKQIIETISVVFSISDEELEIIEGFVFHRPDKFIDFYEILLVNNESSSDLPVKTKHIQSELDGEIVFLKLTSADMYFVKYYGVEEIILNGYIMIPGQVYVFSNGSTIKSQRGNAIYFSDLVRFYLSEITWQRLSFNVHNISYSFSQNEPALHDINISEGPGKLVGIMGVSGSGKTTLLNVMAGINQPQEGNIFINGINLYSAEGKKNLKGVIGYISQDDLLIEELTVFDNLYYNAKLCFASLPEIMLEKKVSDILKSLGLWERKNLKVGSILDKKISGGQRKRLNIALELIREPSILFVDEPTSGLSSRDSENVMDLLKELTYKGKLIFVVIHQPSSDIYKMFDKVYLIDAGGYPIYYGNPIDAVTHFKKAIHQLNSDRGICAVCGNVNPEQIFNIIEERAVDEYGNFVEKRKISPRQWADLFVKSYKITRVKDETELPNQIIDIPSGFGQSLIYLKRDILKKISDKQYIIINLFESPVLAFILAVIVRYNNYGDNGEYRFRFNENFPVFLMMSIIVALFFGLMVSAEEIISDRKILKRESFLNLSWNSYLVSKLGLLFTISAIQTISFVIISNTILEIKGMIFPFWLVLFSVSCFANLLGLNISSAFRNSVTVYILIPLLIIPQMILSGLLVNFDKINDFIGNKSKVPMIADFMTTRWAYEAMAVYQFRNNAYEKPVYAIEQEESQAGFKSTFYVEKMKEMMQESVFLIQKNSRPQPGEENNSTDIKIRKNINVIRNEIKWEPATYIISNSLPDQITLDNIKEGNTLDFFKYMDDIKSIYRRKSNNAYNKKENALQLLKTEYKKNGIDIEEVKNRNYNEKLADLVRNSGNIEKVTVYGNRVVQLSDPIYNKDLRPSTWIDYRAHFFSPVKPFGKKFFDTYWFNIIAIWCQTLFLYVILYYEVLRKSIIFIWHKALIRVQS